MLDIFDILAIVQALVTLTNLSDPTLLREISIAGY